MQVRILNEAGETIWSKSPLGGMAVIAHREDGTLQKIIEALEAAAAVARRELGLPGPAGARQQYQALLEAIAEDENKLSYSRERLSQTKKAFERAESQNTQVEARLIEKRSRLLALEQEAPESEAQAFA